MRFFFQILCFLSCFVGTNIIAFAQIGMASYYSDEFQGAKTASGERYNKEAMTAGHKELPFNTYVRVTRLDNKKSVIVRINDRGPFYESMVIDLSAAAARKLNILQEGKVEVRVEVVEKPSATPERVVPPPPPKEVKTNTPPSAPPKENVKPKPMPKPSVIPPKPKPKKEVPKPPKPAPQPTASIDEDKFELVTKSTYQAHDLYKISLHRPKKRGYGVQVASLSSYENAIRQVAHLQGKWFDNILLSIEPRTDGSTIYKVILGPFEDRDSANYYKKSAKKRYNINGFVVDLSTLRY